MHPMQRVNAPVGAQQHHQRHQGVDHPQVVLLPAVLHRFGNEKRADVMGNAAQGVQGHQLQRRQHQACFFPVIQRLIQGLQNAKIAHGEKHRHKKACQGRVCVLVSSMVCSSLPGCVCPAAIAQPL